MDTEQILSELKERLSEYIRLKTEWLKLTTYEKTAKIIAVLAHSLVMIILGFFSLLFVFISIGFYIGEITGSAALGFLTVFALCLIVLLIIAACRKSIQSKITNSMIKSFREQDDNEDDNNLLTHENGTDEEES
ncbi:phage holin family protein [Odoribacter sp. OttesenSCG-928-J03]|nr:phage holin family protein [Odoribacter sp. OttesenSCG-928-J03]MDL2283316.1 phage holin family protein [Odoribacter sp. OttesenSCG-928-G04]